MILLAEITSISEYIQILHERFGDSDCDPKEEIMKRLEFRVVVSEKLGNTCVIHSLRDDISPKSQIPTDRRKRTIEDLCSNGHEVQYEDQPVLFQFINVHKSFRDEIKSNDLLASIDFEKVTPIIPELYEMTGTRDTMTRDGKSVTKTDTYYNEIQLVESTRKEFEKWTKNNSVQKFFEKWLDLKPGKLKLIKREVVNENGHARSSEKPGRIEESEVKKRNFKLSNWIVFRPETLDGGPDSIQEEIADFGSIVDLMIEEATNIDHKLSKPSDHMITQDEFENFDQLEERIEQARDL